MSIMEDGFDLDNVWESLNLTGQRQPSSMPNILDSSLNSQILGDLVFSADDLSLPSSLNNNDDISNALIDMPIDPFDGSLPGSSFDTDDISQLISTAIGELPTQSIIVDSLEKINLNQSPTDILSSSISVQIGSSPVEQKEIDNSIRARKIVREQHRMHKNAFKSRTSSGYQQSSSTVGPIDFLSSYDGCQPCTTVTMQNDFDYQQQLLQFDSVETKKIQIISHPRASFRPRTQNESENASHYIRCEGNSEHEYPTIRVPHTWVLQSIKNIIEVTLVAMDREPHNYTIDNKISKSLFDDDALIFRQSDLHTLYFCVTPEDIQKGYKSFMIEYIKSRQEGNITKDLIKTRQLDQSMLRFTRIFQADKNTYIRDDNSVEYSCVMTEAYGDIGVEHMGPPYGPMGGNERVYALLKGRVAKEDITIFVNEDTTHWRQPLSFIKNGNLVHFSMPPFPYSQYDRVVTNITICYKGEELHRSNFIYTGSLDQVLATLNLNDSTTNITDPSTSSTFNALDFFSATGVCPFTASSRKSSTVKCTKRLKRK